MTTFAAIGSQTGLRQPRVGAFRLANCVPFIVPVRKGSDDNENHRDS